jgi:hypothetical protein
MEERYQMEKKLQREGKFQNENGSWLSLTLHLNKDTWFFTQYYKIVYCRRV